jgi:hypothetical protein
MKFCNYKSETQSEDSDIKLQSIIFTIVNIFCILGYKFYVVESFGMKIFK